MAAFVEIFKVQCVVVYLFNCRLIYRRCPDFELQYKDNAIYQQDYVSPFAHAGNRELKVNLTGGKGAE